MRPDVIEAIVACLMAIGCVAAWGLLAAWVVE